ncbi:MAG: acyl-ACP thioesterase domain-containing protein [Balneolaceae bacterium]
MDLSTYKDHFTVRSYEVDVSDKCTLPQVANYFQEAAGKHANVLEFDISQLQAKGLTWVLYRMHIKIDEFPNRWEEITVQTWPSSGDGIRAFRDYELTSADGQRIGVGISQWMVLDINKRRPVRMPKEVMEMGMNVENHLLEVDKIPFPKMESSEFNVTLQVGRQDLDMNNHANNVKYIEWMISYLPKAETGSKKCVSINLQYHTECSLNDKIEVRTEQVDEFHFLHNIVRKDSEEILAEGISKWE